MNPYSSCHLGFGSLCSLIPAEENYEPVNAEYEELRSFFGSALEEYNKLDAEYNQVLKAYNFLKTHKVDKGLATYLSDTFALEEVTGLPKECLYAGSTSTSICMEGLGTVLVNVVKKIIAFFKKLYESIMRFFGIKTFRQRRTEGELNTIKRKLEAMSDMEFTGAIKQNVKCNVETMRISEINKVIGDLEQFYNTLMQHKDTDKIQQLITGTSGMLTKIGYKTENEYRIVQSTGLPYQVFTRDSVLNIESSFGIKDRATIFSRIATILKILDTTTELRRWYPANLQKYAQRATTIKLDPNDQASVDAYEESIRKLNEEQKCQAYICRFIVIYLELVDMLCARAIATFGSVTR